MWLVSGFELQHTEWHWHKINTPGNYIRWQEYEASIVNVDKRLRWVIFAKVYSDAEMRCHAKAYDKQGELLPGLNLSKRFLQQLIDCVLEEGNEFAKSEAYDIREWLQSPPGIIGEETAVNV